MRITNTIYTLLENIYSLRLKKGEKSKIKSDNRKKIYSEIKLSKRDAKQIDEFYKKYYGKKISNIWHRYYTAYTKHFDINFFPEIIYTSQFELFMNDPSYSRVFSDKNVIDFISEKANIKMPHKLIYSSSGMIKEGNGNNIDYNTAAELLLKEEKFFIKPSIDTCSGERCELIDTYNFNKNEIIQLLKSYGDDFVVQKVLICHDCVKKLHPESVNTFRIITYRWKNAIYHFPAVMRIGVGKNNIDNAHAGGIFIAVDDDGTLHETAFTEFNKQFKIHPDSGIVFKDYKIKMFDKIISSAYKMHSFLPQVGCVNWDFTLDELGEPVLIEANISGGSIWLSQMSHGVGAFGDRTKEILQWISKMQKLSYSERKKHRFGN